MEVTQIPRKDYLESQADRIRLLSLEATTKAGSGHPTTGMSMADILSVLYFDQMLYDPKNPESPEGDDLVLSKGHGSPALYAAMDLAGILDGLDPMTLRETQSPLEGHPVPRIPGIRLATGSLGQGLSGGIGLALAMKRAGVDRFVYVILGDGEMAEGNVWEAVNLAPHLKMNNLIAIVDVNRLGQSDPTLYEWDTESYGRRIESFGWHVLSIDGHSIDEITHALEEARQDPRPSAIIARTVKGKGVDFLENAAGRHGKAVPAEELEEARKQLAGGIKEIRESQNKPPNVRDLAQHENNRTTPPPPTLSFGDGPVATREGYGRALEALGASDPSVMVLDGDVKDSTRTTFFFSSHPERAVECFIAEQNMVGIAAGLQCRGIRPHVATFAAFLTRAHDQIRMAAYSQADIKFAGSHTGVAIGQDGPSQMGLEDLAMMRSVYGSVVVSPADAVSASKLLGEVNAFHGISYLRTTRGKTPVIYEQSESFPIGGSKRFDPPGATDDTPSRGAIVATGTILHEALKAQRQLGEEGFPVVVIDAYSIKPIDEGTLKKTANEVSFMITAEDHYPEGGLGEAVAGVVAGMVRLRIVAVTSLPHSGKPEELLAEQGIDAAGIAATARQLRAS
ncbi:MAG: transketolase [Spirochaetaceae bacterium]